MSNGPEFFWPTPGGKQFPPLPELGTNRQKVNRCIDKALQLGAEAALSDLPGRGRKRLIGRPARAWSVAGLPQGQRARLCAGIVDHPSSGPTCPPPCRRAGHPSLAKIGRAQSRRYSRQRRSNPTRCAITWKNGIRTLAKMARVLWSTRAAHQPQGQSVAVLSYDEKPQIQAIGGTGVDRPPEHSSWLRDYEYVRHGTVSLLAGIDLLSGHDRSLEFIQFLLRRLLPGQNQNSRTITPPISQALDLFWQPVPIVLSSSSPRPTALG